MNKYDGINSNITETVESTQTEAQDLPGTGWAYKDHNGKTKAQKLAEKVKRNFDSAVDAIKDALRIDSKNDELKLEDLNLDESNVDSSSEDNNLLNDIKDFFKDKEEITDWTNQSCGEPAQECPYKTVMTDDEKELYDDMEKKVGRKLTVGQVLLATVFGAKKRVLNKKLEEYREYKKQFSDLSPETAIQRAKNKILGEYQITLFVTLESTFGIPGFDFVGHASVRLNYPKETKFKLGTGGNEQYCDGSLKDGQEITVGWHSSTDWTIINPIDALYGDKGVIIDDKTYVSQKHQNGKNTVKVAEITYPVSLGYLEEALKIIEKYNNRKTSPLYSLHNQCAHFATKVFEATGYRMKVGGGDHMIPFDLYDEILEKGGSEIIHKAKD